MKLLRLKITDPKGFRSLQPGFEYWFRSEWNLQEERQGLSGKQAKGVAPFVCAGPNGSGKSNILEALSAIFFNIESRLLEFTPRYEDPETGDVHLFLSSNRIKPDAYELEYLIPLETYKAKGVSLDAHVLIDKEPNQEPEISWINRDEFVNTKQFDRAEAKDLLPQFILGYSSGENELLSLPFFKMRFVQLDEYINYLNGSQIYPGQPESRMVYLDNSFSQAILVCLFLFFDADDLKPFADAVGLDALKEFRIILRKRVAVNASNHPSYEPSIEFVGRDPLLGPDDLLPVLKSFEKLEGKSSYELIDKFKRCATCYFEDDDGQLILDYFVNDATKEAFKNNFSNAIELFQSLQILLTLNLYSVSDELKRDIYRSDSHYVKETIPSLASDERVMRFKFVCLSKRGLSSDVMLKDLSDGEHQLIHSLGLCLLFKNTHSLVLLDEPETHFNPGWRANFVSQLERCLQGSDKYPEMLITTHSPFLLSDSVPSKVLEFKKDSDGQVRIKHPEYNTFGASINKITMATFDKRETIGSRAKAMLDDFKRQAQSADKDKDELIDDINRQLGDSVEKVLLIKTILDSMGEDV